VDQTGKMIINDGSEKETVKSMKGDNVLIDLYKDPSYYDVSPILQKHDTRYLTLLYFAQRSDTESNMDLQIQESN